ncbi:MAG: hypothetical protein M0R03_21750 [Novosphingobium sp.]|nr:hypothetical protein [Novosphingobium sp.]
MPIILKRFNYAKKSINHQNVVYDYEVNGLALAIEQLSQYIRPIKCLHDSNYGIDRISISLPIGYLDRDNLKTIWQYSKLINIQIKKRRLWISFQREIFDQNKSIHKQIIDNIIRLHSANGLFKIPILEERIDHLKQDKRTITDRRIKFLNYTEHEFISFIVSALVLEEVEIFFDSRIPINILHGLDLDLHNINGTLYSHDNKRMVDKKFDKKSTLKIYDKLQCLNDKHQKPSELEISYPTRIEFTLRKQKMSYFKIGGLDGDKDIIIERLVEAMGYNLGKLDIDLSNFIRLISRHDEIPSVLLKILQMKRKERLKVSKELKDECSGVRQYGIINDEKELCSELNILRPYIYIKDECHKIKKLKIKILKQEQRVQRSKIRAYIYIKDERDKRMSVEKIENIHSLRSGYENDFKIILHN